MSNKWFGKNSGDFFSGFINSSYLVRLTVQCPELDYPISLPFMKVAQLSANLLLSEIERVLQSYEEFVVDQSLEIEVVHVKLPSGKGHKKKRYVDLEKSLKEKRSFIKIINRDHLCCARAIVTVKARIDKHPKWNSIRKSNIILKGDGMHHITYVMCLDLSF